MHLARRTALVAALTAAVAAAAAAQVPRNLSPVFARARADSTVRAWIIARPGADLDALARDISTAGGRLRRISRFVRGVSAELRVEALASLARRPDVARVQPVAVFVRPHGARALGRYDESLDSVTALPQYRAAAPAGPDSLYGPGAWAFRMLRIPELHQRGLRGAGVRIALLDAGFNTSHTFMAGASVLAQYDFVYNDSIVRDQPGEAQGEMSHGTAVWSLLAANAPGRLVGVAPEAVYLLAKTEFTVTETRVEEDNWVAAVEWAIARGAHIISSSLGYLTFDGGSGYTQGQLNGDIAVTTVAADSAAARGVLVVVSAGNGGPSARTLSTPADADSVLAIGALDSLGNVAGFSSRGPTADGRIKPDLVAPGRLVVVAVGDSLLGMGSGTSFAAPLVAGLAALIQQTRTGRPPVELRNTLIDAASHRFAPDNNRGYGLPDGLAAYSFPDGLRALGPGTGLLQTLSPVLSWDPGSIPPDGSPTLYRVRVSSDSLLAAVLLDTTVAGTSLTLPFAPHSGTRLFWRVVAASATGAVESTAVRGPLVAPAWVELLTLASPQGHSIRDSMPVFVWRSPPIASPPGPFRFDVAIYPASRTPAQAVAAASGLSDTTFQPSQPLERNLTYRWQVLARVAGDSEVVTSRGTFVVLDESVPTATVLYQNFPNPFPNPATGHSTTCIWFDVAAAGTVRLEIYDLRGRLVRRLAPNPGAGLPGQLAAGRYGRPPGDAAGTCDSRFQWDGRDERGEAVRPGVYVYRLLAPGVSEAKRMVYLGER
ncbi:MAG TPA: S8 family serine peptidase [Gemmatimonadales bacterium]|nr:S8 family serine peptidase [Gemmatimonadales bacterium]